MKIYLARHGEKEPEGENPSLTKKGIKQSRLLAKRLKKIKFFKFYCSDLNRTIKTAQVVSNEIKLKPILESCLREFETNLIKRNKNTWTKTEKRQYWRLISFINKIVRNRTHEENMLLIAHGFVNRIVMAYLLKMHLKKFIAFRQNETCLNILYWNEKYKNWQLENMNDDSHVPGRLK